MLKEAIAQFKKDQKEISKVKEINWMLVSELRLIRLEILDHEFYPEEWVNNRGKRVITTAERGDCVDF